MIYFSFANISMSQSEFNENERYQHILNNIFQELEKINPEGGPFNENTDLTRDVQIDSASVMNLIFELEESHGVSIPLNHLADISRIGDLASLILKLKKEI